MSLDSKARKWNMVKEHFPNKRFYLVGESIDDVVEPTEEHVRLQAAAPELYEALVAALNFVADNPDMLPVGESFPRWIAQALGAISKAVK
jgi:hypothetical protein